MDVCEQPGIFRLLCIFKPATRYISIQCFSTNRGSAVGDLPSSLLIVPQDPSTPSKVLSETISLQKGYLQCRSTHKMFQVVTLLAFAIVTTTSRNEQMILVSTNDEDGHALQADQQV
jgi:hypothetical protein